jgi:predicted nucleic acid-binding Zn ribbon protein
MQSAGSALSEVLAELLRVAPTEEAIRLAWPVVCGSKVAARTLPVEFAGGVLRVQVPDRAWCAQLSDLEQRYRQEFARLLGSDTVRQIEFSVGR